MIDLKQAYQMVFSDLCRSSGMFQGYYDANHGNLHFMVGIDTIMEIIAKRAYDEQYAETFAYIFSLNMARSKR